MTASQLNSILQSNVLDLKFVRRRPRSGVPLTRRMLCTLDNTILNSANGRTVLNYLPPTNTTPYNMTGKNLCLAWDILMQDFRMISSESVNIINKYPGNDTFWEIFNQTFIPMSTEQKTEFMNS